MRPEILQQISGVDKAAGGNIRLRSRQCGMEGGAVGVIDPVARIKWEQLNFGAFEQRGRFIQHQSVGVYVRARRWP